MTGLSTSQLRLVERLSSERDCFVQAHLQDYWPSQDAHFARGTRGSHLLVRPMEPVG